MDKLLELLISLSAAGSVVAVCVLLLRFLPPHVFPASRRYIVGKLAVAFYWLPVFYVMHGLSSLLTSRTTTAAITISEGDAVPIALPLPGAMPDPVMTEPTVSAGIAALLLGVWGSGALAFAGWQIYCYCKFMRSLQRTRTGLPEHGEAFKQLAMLKETLGIQARVRLAQSAAIRSPVLAGLWRPTIYLPVQHTHLDLGMVIHHELVHLKRKDLWSKAIILAASALHWFNPLVHLLRHEIHTWSELSCDEEVVKEMSHAERKRYGETLLNVMAGSQAMPVRFCASLSGDGKQLKRRLMLMLTVKKLKTRTMMLTAAILIAAGAAGTSTAVWASKQAPAVEASIVYKHAGDFVEYNGVEYWKYSTLTPEQQQFIVDEPFKGQIYALEGFEQPIPADELSPKQQDALALEEGYYSPDSIERLKAFREKFPRGETVTMTHEDDPSVPPGMSVTLRDLTPEERADMEQRKAENERLRESLREYQNNIKEIPSTQAE